MNCCKAPQSDMQQQEEWEREREPEPAREAESAENEHSNELNELLDEEFESMRRVAQGICQSLLRPKDKECCRTMLEDLAKLNQSDSPEVKENVHKFLTFYLKALRWTQKNQPQELYEKWYGNSSVPIAQDMDAEQRVWVEEGRSYAAMKEFEDGSTLVYVATSKDPHAEWNASGLKSLAQPDGRF
ncbi:uncharacterized protein LOC111080414 [Drosophila obscura]|uniref:uncharacterized protein LOC111080414 n=1 Tax=Drosophila obscura TaxID=7282 RepID=UPI001BB23C15|nr:uncharacterized protein LOC111080414 [Drosophila obscura]